MSFPSAVLGNNSPVPCQAVHQLHHEGQFVYTRCLAEKAEETLDRAAATDRGDQLTAGCHHHGPRRENVTVSMENDSFTPSHASSE